MSASSNTHGAPGHDGPVGCTGVPKLDATWARLNR